MKQSDSIQRRWLRHLALSVSDALRQRLSPFLIRLTARSEIKPQETESDGWYVALGRIRGELQAELQIWLDDWARADTRRVCFCLSARRSAYIEDVIALVHTEFGQIDLLGDEDFKRFPDGYYRLADPLPNTRFGRPLGEIYGHGNYVSLFHRLRPAFSVLPTKGLVSDGTNFLSRITESLVAARASEQSDADYPSEVNRIVVRLHRRHERSSTMARSAKIRDSFKCRVCDFSFAQMYGRLGAGFAEAHHVIPLSKLELGICTRYEDLITVCANCHRMLHHMHGSRRDPARLRVIIEAVSDKRTQL